MILLYKIVVGFLPVPNCKTLSFYKCLSMVKKCIILAHSYIIEQEIDLYVHYVCRSWKTLDNISMKDVQIFIKAEVFKWLSKF